MTGAVSPASNTLLRGHYPAWRDPMTNIGRHRLRNALSHNHSIRRSACDTSPPRAPRSRGFSDAGHVPGPGVLRHAGPDRTARAAKGPIMGDTVLYELS